MSASRLPSKALFLWRLRLLFCCLLPAVAGGFFYFYAPGLFTVFTFVWFFLFLLLCFVYFPMRYSQFTYAITNTMVKVNQGVFYYRMDAVYIRNIQYTALSQTPLQKILGLASLHVFAAGGSVHIHCLPYSDARVLRVQLLKKMESCLDEQSKREANH